MDIFGLAFDLFQSLGGLVTALWEFLTTPVTIPLLGTFNVLTLIGGVGLVVILVYSFVRQ